MKDGSVGVVDVAIAKAPCFVDLIVEELDEQGGPGIALGLCGELVAPLGSNETSEHGMPSDGILVAR